MIDVFTTAIQKSQVYNHPDFVIICYLKPKEKFSSHEVSFSTCYNYEISF